MNNLNARKRISLVNSVAQLERTICTVTNQAPYFDELHDFYEREIDGFVAEHISKKNDLHIDVTKMIADAIVSGTYRPENIHDFMDHLCNKYLSAHQSNRDFTATGKYKQMHNMSKIHQALTYFGIDNALFSLRYYQHLQKMLLVKDKLKNDQKLWLKRCLVLALRHMALTDQTDSFGFIEAIF